MQELLKTRLNELGLGEYEAAVYAALAQRSPASAAALAKDCTFSRSTVYTALERLIAKGLVGTSYRNEVKQFVISDPSALADLLRSEERDAQRRLSLFEQLEPHLRALSKKDASLPNIMFFEGQESLKSIYLRMLREAPKDGTMRILRDEFVWRPEWSFVFDEEWNGRVRRLRAERNVVTRLLVNDSREEKSHHGYYAERKHLSWRIMPKAQSANAFALYVLGETVSILSMERGNLVGIRIANGHIAANFERLFDAVWSASSVPA